VLINPIPKLRVHALEALSVCGDEDCRAAFVNCLRDADKDTRLMAMLCLMRYPVRSARPRLRSLAGSTEAADRAYAILALAHLGDDNDLDVILAHVQDSHESVARQTFMYLAKNRTPRARSALNKIAAQPNESVELCRQLAVINLFPGQRALNAIHWIEPRMTSLPARDQRRVFEFIDGR
jgi:HEAT repeat protein